MVNNALVVEEQFVSFLHDVAFVSLSVGVKNVVVVVELLLTVAPPGVVVVVMLGVTMLTVSHLCC